MYHKLKVLIKSRIIFIRNLEINITDPNFFFKIHIMKCFIWIYEKKLPKAWFIFATMAVRLFLNDFLCDFRHHIGIFLYDKCKWHMKTIMKEVHVINKSSLGKSKLKFSSVALSFCNKNSKPNRLKVVQPLSSFHLKNNFNSFFELKLNHRYLTIISRVFYAIINLSTLFCWYIRLHE